jgi:hypothetical protein
MSEMIKRDKTSRVKEQDDRFISETKLMVGNELKSMLNLIVWRDGTEIMSMRCENGLGVLCSMQSFSDFTWGITTGVNMSFQRNGWSFRVIVVSR